MEMLEIKEMLWPDGNPERGPGVSGHRPWPEHPVEPERRLVAAVILQALVDAGAGDAEAARWLDEDAPAIAWGWLGIDPGVIVHWRGWSLRACATEEYNCAKEN